jgi:two-component system, OmpR family, sensor histidine kinase KdpD
MADDRPNPDHLLARVQAEENRARRGKLRIFFGYAAGVGKTYEMLSAARRERDAGVDVVVGYVEPHGRPETEALLQGFEIILPQAIHYRGVTLREFDLDAMLLRKPRLALVDELAHTNAEGLRHAKRWQDVEELLEAGIDVWTTLNVQHIESLNDVIAQITGVIVRETLPDAVLERADEFELIDITPEELTERLKAGKVYLSKQAERALQNFFQRGNLVALRELSLRQAAGRLQRDVEVARHERSATMPWATSERLLVCVGPSPSSTKIIRAAKRMAAALNAEWMAVAVNRGRAGQRAAAEREQTARNLRFAEQLGAEVHTLIGPAIASTLLEYAQSRNVTKIVLGKTAQPWWRRYVRGTLVDELLRAAGEIDIYVIRGEGEQHVPRPINLPQKPTEPIRYVKAGAVVAGCTLVSWLAAHFGLDPANIAMMFLAGVAIVAAKLGRGPAIAASIVSVLVFDYCFVPPRFTFAISDTEFVITFGVMLSIGLLISALTSRLQAQLTASQQQEHHTSQLLRMTRQLSELSGSDFLLQTAGRQLQEIFAGEVVIYLRDIDGTLQLRFGEKSSIAEHPNNAAVARWVADKNHLAGAATDTLPNATATFVPLVGSQRTVGAIGVRPNNAELLVDPEQVRLLETCASLIALSLERDQSVLDAQEAQVQVQAEQLRNSLLSSVSHELRTPLAAIAGTAASLWEKSPQQDDPWWREMLQTLVDESHQLVRLVDNLLDMARLDAGSITLNRQWHVLEEIIGSALHRLRRELKNHRVRVEIPENFPLLSIDAFLVEQVLVNLIENASRYTPPESNIEISASATDDHLKIRVADSGPGLPPGSEAKLFDKFFRGQSNPPDGRRGVGLGLAICQGIVQAMGGRISAANRRDQHGAEFVISIPCQQRTAQLPLTEAHEPASV